MWVARLLPAEGGLQTRFDVINVEAPSTSSILHSQIMCDELRGVGMRRCRSRHLKSSSISGLLQHFRRSGCQSTSSTARAAGNCASLDEDKSFSHTVSASGVAAPAWHFGSGTRASPQGGLLAPGVRRKSNALHEVDKARLCDNEFDKEMSGTEFPHSGQAKLSSSWLDEFGRECLKALGQHLFGNCRLARAKSERGATPL